MKRILIILDDGEMMRIDGELEYNDNWIIVVSEENEKTIIPRERIYYLKFRVVPNLSKEINHE